MKNIILIGFMGTGKTEVGKILANYLKKEFLDIDYLIEEEAKMSINEIFSRFGEEYFRELESEKVKFASKLENFVIATGGGVVLREDNVKRLKSSGILVWLTASPEEIYNRLKDTSNRPLLAMPDPYLQIKSLLEFRMPYYRHAADIIIPTDSTPPQVVAERIIKKIF